MAHHFVSGGNVDRDSNGKLPGGTGEGARAGAVPSAHCFEWRQLWITSFDFDDSRHGIRRSEFARLVASDGSRSAGWPFVRRDSGSHRRSARRRVGDDWRTISAWTTVRSELAAPALHGGDCAPRGGTVG